MNNNQLQLVNFEQAKRLKAAGFDWPLHYTYLDYDAGDYKRGAPTFRTIRENFNYYSGHISAPTVALALKWLRDVEGIMNAIAVNRHYYGRYKTADGAMRFTDNINTYEAAESALLDEILNLLENEKEN